MGIWRSPLERSGRRSQPSWLPASRPGPAGRLTTDRRVTTGADSASSPRVEHSPAGGRSMGPTSTAAPARQLFGTVTTWSRGTTSQRDARPNADGARPRSSLRRRRGDRGRNRVGVRSGLGGRGDALIGRRGRRVSARSRARTTLGAAGPADRAARPDGAQPWGAGEPPAARPGRPGDPGRRRGARATRRPLPGKDTRPRPSTCPTRASAGGSAGVGEGGSTMAAERPTDGRVRIFRRFRGRLDCRGRDDERAGRGPDVPVRRPGPLAGGEPELVPEPRCADGRGSGRVKRGLYRACRRVRGRGHVAGHHAQEARGGGTSEKAALSGWTTFDQWLSERVATSVRRARSASGRAGRRWDRLASSPRCRGARPAGRPGPGRLRHRRRTASAVALVHWRDERWFVLALLHPDQDTSSPSRPPRPTGRDDRRVHRVRRVARRRRGPAMRGTDRDAAFSEFVAAGRPTCAGSRTPSAVTGNGRRPAQMR